MCRCASFLVLLGHIGGELWGSPPTLTPPPQKKKKKKKISIFKLFIKRTKTNFKN